MAVRYQESGPKILENCSSRRSLRAEINEDDALTPRSRTEIKKMMGNKTIVELASSYYTQTIIDNTIDKEERHG